MIREKPTTTLTTRIHTKTKHTLGPMILIAAPTVRFVKVPQDIREARIPVFDLRVDPEGVDHGFDQRRGLGVWVSEVDIVVGDECVGVCPDD